MRRLAASALALALVPLAGPAGAATRCGGLADPRDVESPWPDSLDITCADIAVGRTEVVAMLTLAGTPVAGAPHGAGFGRWDIGAVGQGISMTFTVRSGLGPNAPLTSTVMVNSTPVRATISVAGTSIRWTVRRRDIPSVARSGSTVCVVAAVTRAYDLGIDEAYRRACKR